jgi:hypothetical protein
MEFMTTSWRLSIRSAACFTGPATVSVAPEEAPEREWQEAAASRKDTKMKQMAVEGTGLEEKIMADGLRHEKKRLSQSR